MSPIVLSVLSCLASVSNNGVAHCVSTFEQLDVVLPGCLCNMHLAPGMNEPYSAECNKLSGKCAEL